MVHYSMTTTQKTMRMAWCAAAGVLALACSGCDPLSFLDGPGAAKPAPKPKPVRTWDVHAVLAADAVLCSADRRIVTVRLAHIIVPGAADEAGMHTLERRTMSSREQLQACGERARAMAVAMMTGQKAVLDPEPPAGRSEAAARVAIHGGIDVGQRLVQEGLAMLADASNAPPVYRDDEFRAIDTERGIWKPVLSADQRFTVQAHVTLHRVGRGAAAETEIVLPPLHARDLVQPPPLKLEDAQEESVSAAMYCRASIAISALGPPREYDVVILLEPLVKGTDLSGPLDIFERVQMSPSEQSISVRGGETARAELTGEPQEIYRVIRATREIYSGFLIDGYLLRVYCEGAIIYSTRGAFDAGRTLSELR